MKDADAGLGRTQVYEQLRKMLAADHLKESFEDGTAMLSRAIAGVPVGLSFIAWAGGDEDLLALCVKLSRYCGCAM